MKLTKHKDGSYSFTGMTRDDVSGLAHGLSAAAARRAQWNGMTTEDIAWAERERESADRLWYVLNAMTSSANSGSIVVTSADNLTSHPDTPYLIESVSGIRGWSDQADITSHLARKES